MIPAYPLQWPAGWPRTPHEREVTARFSNKARGWRDRRLTVAEGVGRVREQLGRMGLSIDDIVISTNLTLRLDGFPRSDQREPADPGAAVYWRAGDATRCMAIDRYDRVADNLAAIAATLDAMRAIERHGGAEVLDRAFTGFTALPAPESWRAVLGVAPGPTTFAAVEQCYRRARAKAHPDAGGDADLFNRVQRAWEAAQQELTR